VRNSPAKAGLTLASFILGRTIGKKFGFSPTTAVFDARPAHHLQALNGTAVAQLNLEAGLAANRGLAG
jgi:hypothetical protein